MAKYSAVIDIQDEIIKSFSTEADHQEAGEYVDKVLSKIGVDIKAIGITPLLKNLSVTYATYKRAFYESVTREDIFFQKYMSHEKELIELTGEVIREYQPPEHEGGEK